MGRSIKKGPYIDPKLLKKIEALKKDLESQSEVFAEKIEKRLLH